MRFYTATKSRNQGRESWSVIFRHPARLEPGTEKPGRRVRRGLAPPTRGRPTRLVDQLNEILRMPSSGNRGPSNRGRTFDARVVDIFYDGLEATKVDFRELREAALPLPSQRRATDVLLLGTTGAGKTTVVRQLLGTDPATERFPSTSTAKTTVADTELITTDEALPSRCDLRAPRRGHRLPHRERLGGRSGCLSQAQ